MLLTPRNILRAMAVAELVLIGYAVIFLSLPPFVIWVAFIVGGTSAVLAITEKRVPIQMAGAALAGIIVILIAMFGGA